MSSPILVTGATGFIGRFAVAALLEHGHEVVALTSRIPDSPVRGASYVEADLLDAGRVASVVRDVRADRLLHLAWRSVVGGLWGSPDNFAWLKAGLTLAEAFLDSGGRRITVSGSCGEYSWAGGLCREGMTPLVPSTVYGSCKLALHYGMTALCAARDAELCWGRAFFVYGPGEHPSRLGASVVLSVLRGEEALCSHGMQLRDYMHAGDVGRGFAALALSGLTGEYNLATGEAIRVRDLVEALADAAGGRGLVRLGARQAPAFEPPLIVADMEKTRNSGLAWAPAFTLESGARDTVEWFRAHA